MARDISDGTYITFGNLTNWTNLYFSSISHSGISRNTIDASHLRTVNGKDFLASRMYDPGEITCELHFDPSMKIDVLNAIANTHTAQQIKISYPNGGTATSSTYAWSAYGYMTSFEITASKEEMMSATATIKLSGDISTGQ